MSLCIETKTLNYVIKGVKKVFKSGGAGAGGFFKKHLPPHKEHPYKYQFIFLSYCKDKEKMV